MTCDGKAVDGVLYPRAGTLGGCTAHNAMILVYPHNADWNQLADLTGDPSWRAEHMRAYFERLERCEHRPDERAREPTRVRTRAATAGRAGCRPRSADAARRRSGTRPADGDPRVGHGRAAQPEMAVTDADRRARLDSQLDPERLARRLGRCDRAPLHAADDDGPPARRRARTRARRRSDSIPDRLKIELHALATRVLFDDDEPRDRRRVPEAASGSTARTRGRAPTAGETRAGVRRARGDPGRRRLQHAAAADAVRHRPQRDARRGTASRSASISPASGRTSRIATRWRSSTG